MNYREILNNLLGELKIKANIVSYNFESPFIIFDLSLHSGCKFKQLEKYSTEIALKLKAISEPLIYPITQEGIVRMEIMIDKQEIVRFSEVASHARGKLPLVLGQTQNGLYLTPDLTQMPHMLIGGTSGSGKSMMLHSIICGMIGKAKLVLVDPKRVEFAAYERDLYLPTAKSADEAIQVFIRLISEMEKRFEKLEKSGFRDVNSYNKFPYIVVIIDELSDLMMSAKKEFQSLLCQLAQKSRACGIHIVAATQRPSVDVVTGLIKANFPARIACRVISQTDSRVILDRGGAEKLLGNGDAILQSAEHDFVRFKGAYVSEEEISQLAKPNNWWSSLWNG